MQTSIAERFAYGHTLDEDLTLHTAPRTTTALVGRILIAVIFLTSGIAKIVDPAGAIGYMSSVGVPNPDALVHVAAAAEVLGGLSVLFGFLGRIGALGLFVFLAITNYYFHAFWALPEPESKKQLVQFTKNLAIMGGLALLVAHGPGRASIDWLLRRPKQA